MRNWAVIITIVLLLCFQSGLVFYMTKTDVVGYHIVKTERVITEGESKYLIFAKEETMENVDSWWGLKFNSSDIYGKIVVGQTCDFTVTGIRFAFWSWYRNILSADCHA